MPAKNTPTQPLTTHHLTYLPSPPKQTTNHYQGLANDHFSPNSRLFSAKDRLDIIWSDVGFFVALSGVGH